LIEVSGKGRLAKILQSMTSTVMPDGIVLVERQEILDDWTRVGNEWLVIGQRASNSITLFIQVRSWGIGWSGQHSFP
jgi:hypothetical protein